MTTASVNSPAEEASPVAIPCIGYEQMAEHWDLIHDLLGGTAAMQEAGQKWLPKESAESMGNYNSRLTRSILYNGFRDTINKLKNRPFTHPITITDLPSEISYLEDDVDGNNKSLETFIKEVLENLIKYGIAHIFVSHSIMPAIEDGKEMTIADEKEAGARVYLINMSPADLIGWQTDKTNNKINLTQIRQKETAIEAEDDYGDVEVNYINVFGESEWEVHKQDADNEEKYEEIRRGFSNFGKIPLITIYANRKGFMTAEPPLMDLAWLNLAHWQSYSDQRNILKYSRFGLLFGRGMPDKVIKKGTIELGPAKCVLTGEDAEHADLKYVEHTGKAIESGRKDIEDIETKMRVLGNQPLIKETPNTATAEKLDENRTVSQLQSWVRSLETGINQALKTACEWRKVTPSADMNVEIYSDFEANILGGTDKELLLKMREAGEITGERHLREQQRRAVLSQDMDPALEAEAAAKESASDLKNFLPDEEEFEEEPPDELEEEV
jgi:hypothetical protein